MALRIKSEPVILMDPQVGSMLRHGHMVMTRATQQMPMSGKQQHHNNMHKWNVMYDASAAMATKCIWPEVEHCTARKVLY